MVLSNQLAIPKVDNFIFLTSSPPHLLTSSPPHLLTSSPPDLLTSSPPHLLTVKNITMNQEPVLPEEYIVQRIFYIRGRKVMFDFDLASLYSVETRALKQQVRRNPNRFPGDFMFLLTDDEITFMVSQNVIPSKSFFGGAKPMVFTEQGVAMLSSILRSKKAIQVNIAIMRAFVQLRRLIDSNLELVRRIDELEDKYDKKIETVFEVIKQLIRLENEPRKAVGYKLPGRADYLKRSGSQEVRKLSEQCERNPEEQSDEGSGSQEVRKS
jgi:hypothetical protein